MLPPSYKHKKTAKPKLCALEQITKSYVFQDVETSRKPLQHHEYEYVKNRKINKEYKFVDFHCTSAATDGMLSVATALVVSFLISNIIPR